MSTPYIEIIISFITGLAYAMLLMPIILRVARNRGMYDAADFRKIHEGKVPRLGGVSFFPSMVLAMLTLVGLNLLFDYQDINYVISTNAKEFTFAALALTAIFCTGMSDDIIGVKYRNKFLIQIICGILLTIGGIEIHSLYGVFGIDELPSWGVWLITTLMTVFIINAINLIDGIDGLACLIFQVTMVCYTVLFLMAGDLLGGMVAAVGFGCTLPFLRYNLFGTCKKNSRIFMGDTGSMTLGLLIATLGMRLLAALENTDITNPAVAALAPIMIPCFDTVRVYMLRIKNHVSPFLPDRNHIHHRLLSTGINQHRVLLILIIFTIFITIVNIPIVRILNVNILLLADVIIWIIFTTRISKIINHKYHN